MSDQFYLRKVTDKRLDINPNIGYGVYKGAQSIFFNDYLAVSQDTSQINFNIQIPSDNIVVCRHVLFESTITLQLLTTPQSGNYPPGPISPALWSSATIYGIGSLVQYPAGTYYKSTFSPNEDLEPDMYPGEWTLIPQPIGSPNTFPVQYGSLDSFCSFPLHSMMQSMTVMINNCSISVPMQDVVCILMRMMDQRELGNYEGGTPSFQDQYFNYSLAVTGINNPLGGYSNAIQYEFVPRGSFSLIYLGNTLPANVSSYNGVAGTGLPPGSQVSNTTTNQGTVYVVAKFIEPLLISPFVYGESWNEPGLLGISAMNMNFNIGQVNRIWREAPTAPTGTAPFLPIPTKTTLVQVEGSKLYFTYLSPHAGDLIESKNVVPYYEIVPYKTNFSYNLGQAGQQTMTSNSYSLSTIPDKLFFFVRPPTTACDMTIPDIYAVIQNIDIQWNARSGLLANASMYELWEMSRNSGCHMSWLEWSGSFAYFVQPNSTGTPPVNYSSFNTVGNGGTNKQQVGCGSMLVLDMARFVSILEDWLAPGSVGTYSLQTTLKVIIPSNGVAPGLNPFVSTWQAVSNPSTLSQWEFTTAVMNSGIFVTNKGASSVNMNLLSKQDVLDTNNFMPNYDTDLIRQIGGNFLGSLQQANLRCCRRMPMGIEAAVGKGETGGNIFDDIGNVAQTVAPFADLLAGLGPVGGGETGGKKRGRPKKA